MALPRSLPPRRAGPLATRPSAEISGWFHRFIVGFIGLSLIYIASELVLFLVIAPARRLVGLCRADFAMASRCGLPLLESGPVAFSVGRDEGSTPRCGD